MKLVRFWNVHFFTLNISDVGWGWGGGGVHYISMGRDVRTKGILFSESAWNGVVFHCKKIWVGIEIYLPGKGFMTVWKGGGELP